MTNGRIGGNIASQVWCDFLGESMKKITFLLFGLAFMGCVTAPSAPVVSVPAWVKDKDAAYPPADYLVFIGSGSDMEIARSNALSQLSGYFGLTIRGMTEGYQSYRQEVLSGIPQTNLEQEITSRVQSFSETKVFAVEYGEAFVTGAEVRIPVYLQRLKTMSFWDQEIVRGREKFELYAAAVVNPSLPLVRRWACFKAAQTLGAELSVWLKNLTIIAPVGVDVHQESFQGRLNSLGREILEVSSIRVQVSGDDGVRIKALVSDKLSKAGFLTGDKGTLTMPVAVTIETGDGGYGTIAAKWTLELSLNDGDNSYFDLLLEGKTGGSSDQAVKNKALKDMTTALETQFIPRLIQKFLSFL